MRLGPADGRLAVLSPINTSKLSFGPRSGPEDEADVILQLPVHVLLHFGDGFPERVQERDLITVHRDGARRIRWMVVAVATEHRDTSNCRAIIVGYLNVWKTTITIRNCGAISGKLPILLTVT